MNVNWNDMVTLELNEIGLKIWRDSYKLISGIDKNRHIGPNDTIECTLWGSC